MGNALVFPKWENCDLGAREKVFNLIPELPSGNSATATTTQENDDDDNDDHGLFIHERLLFASDPLYRKAKLWLARRGGLCASLNAGAAK
jgi:hypothetical protein